MREDDARDPSPEKQSEKTRRRVPSSAKPAWLGDVVSDFLPPCEDERSMRKRREASFERTMRRLGAKRVEPDQIGDSLPEDATLLTLDLRTGELIVNGPCPCGSGARFPNCCGDPKRRR